MKAASFEYMRADSLETALAALERQAGDARLIAGGQSLVPMMAMRLAQPSLLVDIGQLAPLRQINSTAQYIETGALVRQRELEDHPEMADWLPLVALAMPWVGHRQTRNRGTVGGSLAQADPSAELMLVAQVLGAEICLASRQNGERWLSADAMFTGAMTTAIDDTECLTRVRWPRWAQADTRAAFDEVAIRRGDFAIASAAAQAALGGDGRIERISFGVGGVDDKALAFPGLAATLTGQQPGQALVDKTVADAVATLNPPADMHASSEYRRHLAGTLLARVIVQALGMAHQPKGDQHD